MKDHLREYYEAFRPTVSLEQALNHCLDRLFADRKFSAEDEVVARLTFEELIGALLMCKDALDE